MRSTKANYLHALAAKNQQDEIEQIAHLNGYEKMLYLLARHQKTLKKIQSKERKEAFKKEILPDYLPWLEGGLAAGNGAQDNVLMTWQVWAIDCQEYALALRIAEYALHQELALPEHYNRNLPTLLAEEFADKAKKAATISHPFDLSILVQIQQLTEEHDIPDESRARLLREIGLLEKEIDAQQALITLERALLLDGRIGVKTEIKQLQKILTDRKAKET